MRNRIKNYRLLASMLFAAHSGNSAYAGETGEMLPSAKLLAEQTMQIGKPTQVKDILFGGERCAIYETTPHQTLYTAIVKAAAQEYSITFCDVGNNGVDSLDNLNIRSREIVDVPISLFDNIFASDRGLDGKVTEAGESFEFGEKRLTLFSAWYNSNEFVPPPEFPRFERELEKQYVGICTFLIQPEFLENRNLNNRNSNVKK